MRLGNRQMTNASIAISFVSVAAFLIATPFVEAASIVSTKSIGEVPWLGIGIVFVFLTIGGIGGWFLGLSGFIENANSREFRSSLRLKNFQYLIGGLAIATVGDYRKFGLPDDFPSIIPATSFIFGATIMFVITVLRTESSIRKTVRTWNLKYNQNYQIDVESMIREYRHLGKLSFDNKFADETSRIRQEAKETVTASRRARHAEANRAIARCTYAALHHQGHAQATAPEPLIEAILDAACAAVRAHSLQPDIIQLSGSFMIFVPDEETQPEVRAKAMFKFDDPARKKKADEPSRYRGYLVLRFGARYSSGNRVILPVEPADAKAELVLPGAPTVAHNGSGFAIMNVRPPTRPGGIHKSILKEIDEFLSEVQFASVTSIPILSTEGFHGVINIESSEPDLLGEDHDATIAACASLQPVAALLSRFK
jgi:hypothetical protein